MNGCIAFIPKYFLNDAGDLPDRIYFLKTESIKAVRREIFLFALARPVNDHGCFANGLVAFDLDLMIAAEVMRLEFSQGFLPHVDVMFCFDGFRQSAAQVGIIGVDSFCETFLESAPIFDVERVGKAMNDLLNF